MFKRILVAVDESKVAFEAVDVAAQLAAQLGAQIAAVHVVDDNRAYVLELSVLDNVVLEELTRAGVAALDAAARRIPPELNVERLLVQGEPSEMIISTARDWHADLIVLGNDSRGRLVHFLLGSTADSVIRRAPCPVVAVRSNGKDGQEQGNARAVASV